MLYKDLRILYSHEKRKLSNGHLRKIWKETAFIELCSFFIDLLAFELGKLCPGWGFLFRFFDPGPEFCTEKLSQAGILAEKISGGGGGGLDGNRSN